MNREERRRMMKLIPGSRKAVKTATKKAMDDLENAFKRRWENDETLNDGERSYEDDGEDEVYND